jgi:hypothetical protein
MAGLHAIGTITLAIAGVFDQAKSRINVPGIKVEAVQGPGLKTGPNGGVGLTIYMHRAVISTARRALPPRVTADGRRLRPSLPLDVFYLISAWGKKPEVQHYVLAWAMRTLEDTPTLTGPLLNGYDPANKPFAEDETVDLVFDPISIQDMLNIWEVGKPNIQPSVGYVARVVPIDSEEVERTHPVVQVRGP